LPWRLSGPGGFRREVQPRRQHWFLKRKPGFPFRTLAFCSVSKGQRRLGEKEYRAPSVTPGVALRVGIQALSVPHPQYRSQVLARGVEALATVPTTFLNPGRKGALTDVRGGSFFGSKPCPSGEMSVFSAAPGGRRAAGASAMRFDKPFGKRQICAIPILDLYDRRWWWSVAWRRGEGMGLGLGSRPDVGNTT
jgi:hypothetical protein